MKTTIIRPTVVNPACSGPKIRFANSKAASMGIIGILAVGLSDPAAAADDWYLGVGFAPAWFNTEFQYSDGSKLSPDFDTGVFVDATAGIHWGPNWRLEIEPYWTISNAGEATVTGSLKPQPRRSTNDNSQITGDVTVGGILLNVAYDTPIGHGFSFTVGGGLGWAYVTPNVSTLSGSLVAQHGNSALTWQLLAGLTYVLNNNVDLQMDYRYRGIEDSEHPTSFTFIAPAMARRTDVQALMLTMRWYPSLTR